MFDYPTHWAILFTSQVSEIYLQELAQINYIIRD